MDTTFDAALKTVPQKYALLVQLVQALRGPARVLDAELHQMIDCISTLRYALRDDEEKLGKGAELLTYPLIVEFDVQDYDTARIARSRLVKGLQGAYDNDNVAGVLPDAQFKVLGEMPVEAAEQEQPQFGISLSNIERGVRFRTGYVFRTQTEAEDAAQKALLYSYSHPGGASAAQLEGLLKVTVEHFESVDATVIEPNVFFGNVETEADTISRWAIDNDTGVPHKRADPAPSEPEEAPLTIEEMETLARLAACIITEGSIEQGLLSFSDRFTVEALARRAQRLIERDGGIVLKARS